MAEGKRLEVGARVARRARLAAVGAFLLALATAGRPALADPKHAADEAKQRAALAKGLIDAATWLKDRACRAAAERVLAEAREADPRAPGLSALCDAVAAIPAVEGEEPPPEAAPRLRTALAEAAKGYDRLTSLPHDEGDDARFDGYSLKALDLDPSKGRVAKATATLRALSGNRGKAVSAGRLLVALRAIEKDAAGRARLDAVEQDLAASDVALVVADGHPLVGWLSLPKGAVSKGELPVLVAVDGAGSNFLGACRSFRDARGSRRAIVLAPCTLSNTNELKPETYPFYAPTLLAEQNARRLAFDLEGIEGLRKVLRERYGAAEKVAITGFSGGGNACYGLTMRSPSRVACAVPACANFQPGVAGDAAPVEGGGPPVLVLTGANDEHRDQVFGAKPGIEGQADGAMEAFARLGFSRVRRTMLPGVGHSPCVREVWAFFDETIVRR